MFLPIYFFPVHLKKCNWIGVIQQTAVVTVFMFSIRILFQITENNMILIVLSKFGINSSWC